jgi:hypothetical protein
MSNFVVAQGYLGVGKTLGATLWALDYQQRSGCALYSNFGIKGSKPFTHIDDFKKIAMEESSILVLDEAHMDLDARSFSSNHVKFFTQVSYYLRKLRCTVVMTSPSFNDLDSRIRGVTNLVLNVAKDKERFYYDVWDIQSNRYLKTLRIKRENAYMFADEYFNTNNMVVPVQMPSKREDWTEFLDELKFIAESYHTERKETPLAVPNDSMGTNLVLTA